MKLSMFCIGIAIIVASMVNCTGDNRGGSGAQRAIVGSACTKDADCRADLMCADVDLGGHCEKDCTTDAECGEGAICSSDLGGVGGTCYHACAASADCRADRVCAGGVKPRLFCDVRQPVGASCLDDSGCQAGLTCADVQLGGHCEKDCATDAECGVNGICTSDAGGVGGTCYRKCAADTDCRSDRACVGGVAPRKFCDPRR